VRGCARDAAVPEPGSLAMGAQIWDEACRWLGQLADCVGRRWCQYLYFCASKASTLRQCTPGRVCVRIAGVRSRSLLALLVQKKYEQISLLYSHKSANTDTWPIVLASQVYTAVKFGLPGTQRLWCQYVYFCARQASKASKLRQPNVGLPGTQRLWCQYLYCCTSKSE